MVFTDFLNNPIKNDLHFIVFGDVLMLFVTAMFT